MLFRSGELFEEIQKRKAFSEETAADIINQILSAIVYFHERKIVHKDLKPENILIDSRNKTSLHIKIIDFGTAEEFTPSSTMNLIMGTVYYIAPEVLMKSYNEKCDVWSCGVILYILLSGTPPFNGKTDEDILKAVMTTKFKYYSKGLFIIGDIWINISDDAKDLIHKMIKYPPEERLSAKEDYSHDWIKSKKFNQFKPEISKAILSNLKNFHVINL